MEELQKRCSFLPVCLTRDRAVAQWRGLVVPEGNVEATSIVKQCGGCYLRTSLSVISVTKWLLFLYFYTEAVQKEQTDVWF